MKGDKKISRKMKAGRITRWKGKVVKKSSCEKWKATREARIKRKGGMKSQVRKVQQQKKPLVKG